MIMNNGTNTTREGVIVAVNGPVVDVQFKSEKELPGIFEVLETKAHDGTDIVLDIVEHMPGNICRCIALTVTYGVQRGSKAIGKGRVLSVPPPDKLYGRIVDVMGRPIDNKEPPACKDEEMIPIRQPHILSEIKLEKTGKPKFEILQTGIKIIDLLFPLVKGSKTGVLGGAALGKSILILEIIHNIIKGKGAGCVCAGIGERVREGNELYFEFVKAGLLERSILLFGQMNEPPGARFEIAQTAVSIAEAIQKKGVDVLFFMDNIFRFAQAGSELSALLGRIPSETGYQPTLISEIGELHERIRSTKNSSITAVEAVYVPADDVTDPAVVAIFSHLDSIMALSRTHVQRGLYPAIDPVGSSSGFMSPHILGKRHYDVAQEAILHFQKYEELQRIVSIVGKEELSKHERIIFERARKLQFFLTQPFFVAEKYTGKKGAFVQLDDTLKGCELLFSGRLDRVPEQHFYLIGTIDEIKV